jgi:flagella basal body P-ring formation protein FlgA
VGFEAQAANRGRTHRGQGSATVRAYASVAVATSRLQHGEALNESNIRFEEREIGKLAQNGYYLDAAAFAGRRVKGVVSAGQAIGRANTQAAYLVQPGEGVELYQRRGALVLRAKVKALQGGLLDQWVQVRNPSSGKIFLARVAGPGEVEVR